MTKKDLTTGMFGVMSNGQSFVIVNDLIVYQEGGFDFTENLKDDLSFNHYCINELVYAQSFRQAQMKSENTILLYDRLAEMAKKETVMTIAEIEKKLGIKNLRIIGEEKCKV